MFAWDLAAVCFIGVSVIAGCSQDESTCCVLMHLSMLSPRVGRAGYPREIDGACLPQGREFDIAAILED